MNEPEKIIDDFLQKSMKLGVANHHLQAAENAKPWFWIGLGGWAIGMILQFSVNERFAALTWAGIVVEWIEIIYANVRYRKARKIIKSLEHD